MRHVRSSRVGRPSGQALDDALVAAGYQGPPIPWGWGGNKRVALERMTAAGVPTLLMMGDESDPWPVVARPDFHHGGRWLYVCHDATELAHAYRPRRHARNMPTHCQLYRPGQEYRVHVIRGQSVKISQKIGGGNHATGATFGSAAACGIRRTLRQVAKDAVTALGLDIGAVDLIMPDGLGVRVLEVNTAPRLTDPQSDTLARYVAALTGQGGTQ